MKSAVETKVLSPKKHEPLTFFISELKKLHLRVILGNKNNLYIFLIISWCFRAGVEHNLTKNYL